MGQHLPSKPWTRSWKQSLSFWPPWTCYPRSARGVEHEHQGIQKNDDERYMESIRSGGLFHSVMLFRKVLYHRCIDGDYCVRVEWVLMSERKSLSTVSGQTSSWDFRDRSSRLAAHAELDPSWDRLLRGGVYLSFRWLYGQGHWALSHCANYTGEEANIFLVTPAYAP